MLNNTAELVGQMRDGTPLKLKLPHAKESNFTMFDVANANALYDAYKKSRKNSDWKTSVQTYEIGLWVNIYETRQMLLSGKYTQRPYVEFDIKERGKTRHIKSVHISDRVVQRSLCDNVLTPATERFFIYDNGASQLGKGTDFTRQRLVKHLRGYYQEYGTNDGYVVVMDFENYFGSLDHEILKTIYHNLIWDKELQNLIDYLIDVNGEEVGMGIGSQISQNAGILYPTPIDQYFKTTKGLKYYAAHMDDRYAIFRTKEEAKRFLKDFEDCAKLMKLKVKKRKTHIIKLSSGFNFLKMRYTLTETGKVIIKQSNETFARERRKLKKFGNKMTPERAVNCYKGWRGGVAKLKTNKSRVEQMDELVEQLYPNIEFKPTKEKKNDN